MSNLEARYLGGDNVVSNDLGANAYDRDQNNTEKLAVYAYDNGLEIVLPNPNELFVDLDSEQAYELFLAQIEVLKQILDVTEVSTYPSKSGLPCRHARVTVRIPKTRGGTLGVMERLALQTMLGSDRRCEILRYMRHCFNDPNPTLFLEKKNENS